MGKDVISMEVVNPNAAGVDIGSRSHWVAVGQKSSDIREYGVYNEDLYSIADWLSEVGVTTVAMESTGSYWQSLYAVLLSKGFEVVLCMANSLKIKKEKRQT